MGIDPLMWLFSIPLGYTVMHEQQRSLAIHLTLHRWKNLDLDTISSWEIPCIYPPPVQIHACPSDGRRSQPSCRNHRQVLQACSLLFMVLHHSKCLHQRKASIFVNLKTAREKLSSGICVSNRVFEAVPTSAGTKKKSIHISEVPCPNSSYECCSGGNNSPGPAAVTRYLGIWGLRILLLDGSWCRAWSHVVLSPERGRVASPAQ